MTGMVLVCGTNEGLYARCRGLATSQTSSLRLRFQHIVPGEAGKLHEFDVPLSEKVNTFLHYLSMLIFSYL